MIWVDLAIIGYFLALNMSYILLLFLSALELARSRAVRLPELDHEILGDPGTPPVSVIAPAYNESEGIVDSVRALLQLDYPYYQVIVVNDGSTDDTLAKLRDRFDLVAMDLVVRQALATEKVRGVYQARSHPRLWVVDKVNGGKADALNVGLNIARTPLVCCVDADSIIDRRALLRLVEPFTRGDGDVVAAGGTIRLANGSVVKDGIVSEIHVPKSWLGRFQVIEYLRAFLFARMGFNRLGGNLIVSGAMGLFDREAVLEAGGYEPSTVGEDMELIVRLHHEMRRAGRPYHVAFIPDPVCFTEAPESIAVLGRQRDRWQRGLIDSLWRHKAMFLNPFYGLPGVFTFPLYVLFEMLGPIVELFGYFWFTWALLSGRVDAPAALLFFTVAFLMGMLISLQALILDDLAFRPYSRRRDRLLLIAAAALENFGFRQLVLMFRIIGTVKFFFGATGWGRMTRKGFAGESTKTQGAAA